MSIVLRFVDKDGYVQERFFGLVHVKDTVASTFKEALQLQSRDILNAMHLVSSTKLLIQNLRDDRCDELVANVKSFCEEVSISMSDFSAQYIARRGRALHQQDEITAEHHFKVDIFNVVIDSQLQELNNKFNDNTIELIILSSALDPREMHNAFRIDDICRLNIDNYD
ncbi:uncharacterized protein [Henckelia pumila]|uniref:uncharacterized protein n=1 Tax=Henckelia pumila TaxID=405737 RepID=UPI003C6E6BA8